MIIGLTGNTFSGKDTAGLYMAKAHNFALFAFADPIRDGLAAMLDIGVNDFSPERKEAVIPWIGKSPRQLMQTLGTEWGRNLVSQTLWTTHMRRRIDQAIRAGDDVVITDVRFNTEAVMIKSLGGEIWRIYRPDAETTRHNQHASETEACELPADRALMNDGTMEQLYEQIDGALGFVFEIAGETAL